MNKTLTAVINRDKDQIVYMPVENRLVRRHLIKHPKLDIMIIRDNKYQTVRHIIENKAVGEYDNRKFLVEWVKAQPIKDAGKLNEEGLALLHDNLTFDGNVLTDIMINIEHTLASWHTDTVEAFAVKQNLNTDGMDEEDLQDAVIKHIYDNHEFTFEGLISEGDDYLIVYSDLAGARTYRAPKKVSERHLPVNFNA